MMKEVNLRKWHRHMGITLAFFVFLQAGSGILISLREWSVPHTHADERAHTPAKAQVEHDGEESGWHQGLEFIHHGAGTLGTIYRILVGIALLWMLVSGSMIFIKMHGRARRSKK